MGNEDKKMIYIINELIGWKIVGIMYMDEIKDVLKFVFIMGMIVLIVFIVVGGFLILFIVCLIIILLKCFV